LIFIIGIIQSGLIHKPSEGKEYTLMTDINVGKSGMGVGMIIIGLITIGIAALGLLQSRCPKSSIGTLLYIIGAGLFGFILLIIGFVMAGFVGETMFQDMKDRMCL